MLHDQSVVTPNENADAIFKGMSHDASVTTRDENRLVVQWMETTNVSDVDNDLVPASP